MLAAADAEVEHLPFGGEPLGVSRQREMGSKAYTRQPWRRLRISRAKAPS
jgi:hypothetical protein